MFDEMHYVPVLKWRQGEYLALERLSAPIKDWLTPLFELPKEAWDFEEKKAAKSLDEHLEKLGTRLKKSWGTRRCFFDSCYVTGDDKTADGNNHLLRVFNLARSNNCQAVPVTGLTRHADYQVAVAKIVALDGRGICLRLTVEDLSNPLGTNATKFLANFSLTPSDVDVVIDAEDTVNKVPAAQVAVWQHALSNLPTINKWRSLTVTGASFPSSLVPPSKFRPTGTSPRDEWKAYAALLGKPSRMPTFGDYAAAAFKTELIDPRYLDPNAKVKYTIADEWLIAVGKQLRANGRAQYVDLCKNIINNKPKVFAGAAYSWGDKYIADCAGGTGSTGGSSSWPCVATNHHVTRIVRDLAKLHGSSVVP